ncbi:MAG: sulfopyruvate decarboxylase subunit alpha [Spirochaetes bacterium]|nr:sulfopyruvate decarboxylase subunit alpha [Spirochaetota bacterium]
MTPTQALYKKLRDLGLNFFASVPCKFFSEMITILEGDRDVGYIPVAREEEGIGVLAGAYLAGKKPAMVMQNSGLGNSINAICSLLNYYRIPTIFIISHRGTEGEKIEAQVPMGNATVDLLSAASVTYHHISSLEDLQIIDSAVMTAFSEKKSSALLLPLKYWNCRP